MDRWVVEGNDDFGAIGASEIDDELLEALSGEDDELGAEEIIGGRFRRRRRRIRARRRARRARRHARRKRVRRRRKARRRSRRRRGKGFFQRLKKIGKVVKKVGSVASFMFPPAAGAIGAFKLAAGVVKRIKRKGKIGRKARQLVRNTATLAKKGDTSARQGLQLLALAKKLRAGVKKKRKLAKLKIRRNKKLRLRTRKFKFAKSKARRLKQIKAMARAMRKVRAKERRTTKKRLLKIWRRKMAKQRRGGRTGIMVSPKGIRHGRWLPAAK